MSANRGESEVQVAALAKLVQGSIGTMTPTQRARGLERLSARLEQRRRRRPARLVLSGGVLAVAAVALLVGLPRIARHGGADTSPLAYRVEAGALGPGGTLVSSGAAEPALRFADGSSVK